MVWVLISALALAPAWVSPAQAAEGSDVRALSGTTTRTLVVEDVPPCNRPAASGGRSERTLRVGAEAVTLRIEFGLGTARLEEAATRRLDQLAASLADPQLASARFIIAGHTDASGSAGVNARLSCARALAVRNYLQQHAGVENDRLHVEGFGALRPLDPTHPLDAANRRVEVRRLVAEPP